MLGPVTPGGENVSVTALVKLLELISDPAALKAELENIKAVSEQAGLDIATANKATSDANDVIAQAHSRMADADVAWAKVEEEQKSIALATQTHEAEKQKLADMVQEHLSNKEATTASLADRENAVAAQESELAERIKNVESGFAERETVIVEKEKATEDALNAATSLKNEYAGKIDALRKLTS